MVAVSDYMRAVQDQISRWVPNDYTSLGTDGWGLADTRAAARRHFQVDAESIVVATLAALAKRGDVKPEVVAEAARTSTGSTTRPPSPTSSKRAPAPDRSRCVRRSDAGMSSLRRTQREGRTALGSGL